MARTQRVDRALETPKRGIWIATGVVVLAGLVALLWTTSPSERERREAVGRLAVGDPAGRVTALLGEPPARCPGAVLGHLSESFPPGWPAASAETALQALGARTRERWVYPLGSGAAGCAPAAGQTEVGVDADGRVLWVVAVTGETPLRLPEEISPARPDGAP